MSDWTVIDTEELAELRAHVESLQARVHLCAGYDALEAENAELRARAAVGPLSPEERRELADLRQFWVNAHAAIDRWDTKCSELRAQLELYRYALDTFGTHGNTCRTRYGHDLCNCGLTALRKTPPPPQPEQSE